MKKQELKKIRRGLGTSGIIVKFQHLNHRGYRRRRGREKIENLFEQIMKDNFLSPAKEIDMQVQNAQSPIEVGSKQKKKLKSINQR